MSLVRRVERLERATATDDAPIVAYCPPGHVGRYYVGGETLTVEEFDRRYPGYRGKVRLTVFRGNVDPFDLVR